MITIVKYLFLKKNVYYIRYVNDDNDDDDDDDDDDEKLVYYKILNDFNRMVSIRNNIVNLINNDNYEHNVTLLVDHYKIFICQNDIC